MVQVTQDRMMEVRKQLSKMEDVDIDCGPVGAEAADETVRIKWVDAKATGSDGGGVKSLVDGRSLEGVPSVRFAVKITLDSENTGYDAGSHGTSLPPDLMAVLDN